MATSTTRATVSRLVDDLVGGGLLDELAPDDGRPRARGRPGTPLVAGTGVAALGLQVDVDRLAAVVVDLAGRSRVEKVLPGDHRGSSPRPVLTRLARLAAGRSTTRRPRGRRSGPGPARHRGRRRHAAARTEPRVVGRASGRPARSAWSTGCRARVGNEADLAALTVAYAAPGRPGAHADFLYLSGSTGIGGAVVLGGRPVVGRHGWAGEVGHVTVDPDGPSAPADRPGASRCTPVRGPWPRRPVWTARPGATRSSAWPTPATRGGGGGRPCRPCARRRAVDGGQPARRPRGRPRRPPARPRRAPAPSLERAMSRRVLSASWAPPSVVVADSRPLAPAVGAAYSRLIELVDDPRPWCDARSARGGSRRPQDRPSIS